MANLFFDRSGDPAVRPQPRQHRSHGGRRLQALCRGVPQWLVSANLYALCTLVTISLFQQKLSLPMHSGHCDRPGWSSWGFVQRHRGFKLCRGGDGRPSTVRTPACPDGSRGARLLSYRHPSLPLSRWMDCVRHHWWGDCCAFGRHNHTLGSLVHQEGR